MIHMIFKKNKIMKFSRIKNDGEHIKVEEDKLKVIWNAALVEKWLVSNEHREIKVNSYDVTIFPAESSKNSVTKKAKLTTNSMDKDADKYSAWFFDLAGKILTSSIQNFIFKVSK